MRIQTTRFGELEIEESRILFFPQGILGFGDLKRYVILDHDREVPFKWMQAVDDPDVAFVVTDPQWIIPGYRVVIQQEVLAELKPRRVEDLIVLVILTIPPEAPEKATANLQGPIIVNVENRLAKQVVLVRQYTTRYPIAKSPYFRSPTSKEASPEANLQEPLPASQILVLQS